MTALQQLFHKLIQPYESSVENNNFRELHNFFWQQLPEMIEFGHRPQAKSTIQTLQKLYRELLLYTLYPRLKQTTTITVIGDYQPFLAALDLAWYQLTTPLFIQKGAAQATGLNLFQMPQTFAYAELQEITADFSHLLQHLYLQNPLLPSEKLAFVLPFQQEQFILTDYLLYFLTAENKDSCYALIHQQPQKYHFLVTDNSNLATDLQLPNVIVLSSDHFMNELVDLELEHNPIDIFQAFETQFSSYHHALELLMNYEQRQLTLSGNDLAKMAKHQSQLKQLQQELSLWQTFHLRFHRLINTLLGVEGTEYTPQLQPLLATTQVLQAFQKRTHRQKLANESHPFESLLTLQPKPQRATPVLSEQFKTYLQKTWDLPTTIPFRKTLMPVAEGEE